MGASSKTLDAPAQITHSKAVSVFLARGPRGGSFYALEANQLRPLQGLLGITRIN
jgi:hypothetical protein